MIPIRSPSGDGEMSVLDFGDAGRPIDLVFLHANGFNAMTYRSVLAPLSASLRLVLPDMRGHGASRLAADPRGRRSWNDLRDDLLALLEALDGPPVLLAGHSMGATTALLAAGERPDRVSGLLLFDAVIFPPLMTRLARLPGAPSVLLNRFPLARAALRRRAEFPSRQAAFQSYRGRGAFQNWPETALADYVSGGFVERADGSVELACAPAWEASNYAAHGHDPWRALARYPGPVVLLKAEHGSTTGVGDGERLHRRHPNVTLQTAPGDHFFPIERADIVRDAVLDAVSP